MIALEGSTLTFRFPEVHEDAVLRISFQRTLRVPDDGRIYPLPAGLGTFPLRHADDHLACCRFSGHHPKLTRLSVRTQQG